ILSGDVILKNDALLTGSGQISGSVSMQGGAVQTLDNSNSNLTIGSLAGAGTVTLGAGTLIVGGNNTTTNFSGVISGTGGLTKIGTGKMVLTAANPYTGLTIVNGGILEVDGSQGSSSTFVNTSGTLAGGGTVGPLTVNAGATLGLGSTDNLKVNGNANFANS